MCILIKILQEAVRYRIQSYSFNSEEPALARTFKMATVQHASGVSMNVRSHFASHHDGKVGCRRLNFGNGGRQSTTTSTTQQP
ncbi:uncharacterized protein LOC125385280 isoform X2 [Bombus terrestris]|uniref:Uncharacterized protein LOC125385280 isoform X2 n=1 Tax=Bombus terrestris TaxID=30195 RepID=A0A9C6VZR2_BOMTE|nr:uncharacterized protein LOC125385280 isoform X2 [Bombus terrestris]